MIHLVFMLSMNFTLSQFLHSGVLNACTHSAIDFNSLSVIVFMAFP